jgi:hypothetical protein
MLGSIQALENDLKPTSSSSKDAKDLDEAKGTYLQCTYITYAINPAKNDHRYTCNNMISGTFFKMKYVYTRKHETRLCCIV